ncbi:MAG: dihydrofolate reductase [Deltaproteobacteria bacterium]|nr:dihydrofolate reductase [Deltaproteobacteria bacterium]
MKISIIAAVGLKGEIGREGSLPWHLPSDLRNFKKLTMGHCLLVGRTTYEAIGKALPGRKMFVLSRNADFAAPDCKVVGTWEEAISLAREQEESELFVAGGGKVYETCLPYCSKMYLSKVFYDGPADTYFPEMSWEGWERTQSVYHPDEGQELAWQFEVWERKSQP